MQDPRTNQTPEGGPNGDSSPRGPAPSDLRLEAFNVEVKSNDHSSLDPFEATALNVSNGIDNRLEAVRTIALSGSPDAAERLRKIFVSHLGNQIDPQGLDFQVKNLTIKCLFEMHQERMVFNLFQHHEQPFVRVQTLRAVARLEQWNSTILTNVLLALGNDSHESVRSVAFVSMLDRGILELPHRVVGKVDCDEQQRSDTLQALRVAYISRRVDPSLAFGSSPQNPLVGHKHFELSFRDSLIKAAHQDPTLVDSLFENKRSVMLLSVGTPAAHDYVVKWYKEGTPDEVFELGRVIVETSKSPIQPQPLLVKEALQDLTSEGNSKRGLAARIVMALEPDLHNNELFALLKSKEVGELHVSLAHYFMKYRNDDVNAWAREVLKAPGALERAARLLGGGSPPISEHVKAANIILGKT